MPALRASLAVLLILALAVSVPGVAGAQSLDEVRQQRDRVQDRLDTAAQQMADLEARIGTLADESDTLSQRVDRLQATSEQAQARVVDRLRDMFKRGVDTPILQLLASDDPSKALERAQLASQLLDDDRVAIETAVAARAQTRTAAETLADRQNQLAAARADLRDTVAGLRKDLATAQQLENRLAEQAAAAAAAAARARASANAPAAAGPPDTAGTSTSANAPAAPPSSSGGRACPVGRPHSFTDTWGAPRSGGRSHEGVDILADYGTPVYAIVSGVWDVYGYRNSAGNWAILRGDDGNTYYYMHLQRHVVGDGARVSAGTQTATVGDTGNAAGTPHLHFEYHPGGGGAVNPTAIASSAC